MKAIYNNAKERKMKIYGIISTKKKKYKKNENEINNVKKMPEKAINMKK